MSLLWNRVMPMLQCWKVLVPVKKLDGFKSAISSLERLVQRMELIEQMPVGDFTLLLSGTVATGHKSLWP
jgi:hypothetical protein